MDVINELILQAATSPWLPLVMFAVALIDGFFPPIPSETVLVAAVAVAASTGDFPTIVMLCIVAAIGATIGDNIAYAVGSKVGSARFGWMRRPRIAAAFDRAGAALTQRGAPLILGARYIPVGRVAVNMSAGALHYPWRRFLPISAVAAMSWALYSVVIGAVAGRWLEGQPLLSAVIGVVFAVVLGLVIDRVVTVRRRRREAAAVTAGAVAQAEESVGADAPRTGEQPVPVR